MASPITANKVELKQVLSHFYKDPFARGALQDYIHCADPKRDSRQILLSASPDSKMGHVLAVSLANGVLNFSVTSDNKELGKVDLGTFDKKDILEVVNKLNKVSPVKRLRNIDDSPNVCMR